MVNNLNRVRNIYRVAIVVLLFAVVTVQFDIAPFFKNYSTSHSSQPSENKSVISVVDAIANLYLLLPIFIDPEKRVGMTLEERQATKEEFVTNLDKIPEDTIIEKMIDLDLVTALQLDKINHKRAFINRLAQVAMNGVITPTTNEPASHGGVFFKSSLNNLSKEKFSTKDQTLYAIFDTSSYGDEKVFVKWYETVKGRMSLFKQFPIAEGSSNYIWINDTKGFLAGQYQVEIYRISETFELLSKGSYQIQ